MQIFDILIKYKTNFCDGAIYWHFRGKQEPIKCSVFLFALGSYLKDWIQWKFWHTFQIGLNWMYSTSGGKNRKALTCKGLQDTVY